MIAPLNTTRLDVAPCSVVDGRADSVRANAILSAKASHGVTAFSVDGADFAYKHRRQFGTATALDIFSGCDGLKVCRVATQRSSIPLFHADVMQAFPGGDGSMLKFVYDYVRAAHRSLVPKFAIAAFSAALPYPATRVGVNLILDALGFESGMTINVANRFALKTKVLFADVGPSGERSVPPATAGTDSVRNAGIVLLKPLAVFLWGVGKAGPQLSRYMMPVDEPHGLTFKAKLSRIGSACQASLFFAIRRTGALAVDDSRVLLSKPFPIFVSVARKIARLLHVNSLRELAGLRGATNTAGAICVASIVPNGGGI